MSFRLYSMVLSARNEKQSTVFHFIQLLVRNIGVESCPSACSVLAVVQFGDTIIQWKSKESEVQ